MNHRIVKKPKLPPKRAAPVNTAQLSNEAASLYNAGRVFDALKTTGQALSRNPNDNQALMISALSLERIGDHAQAVPLTTKLVDRVPGDATVHALHGICLRMVGRTDEAIESLDRAIELDPSQDIAVANKVWLLLALNRSDEARSALEPHWETAASSHHFTLAKSSLLRHAGEDRAAYDAVIARLDAARSGERAALLYIAADLADRLDLRDAAIDHLQHAANASQGNFNPTRHREATDAAINALTPQVFGALMDTARAAYRPKHPLPAFVLGAPRSGSTLVERILARHPAVHPGGELTTMYDIAFELQPATSGTCPVPFFSYQRLTRGLLGKLTRRYQKAMPGPENAGDLSLVTDKLPGNALHIPLVRLLFPDAPIVVCTRDPRDTAVSCLFNEFVPGLAWTKQLDWIRSYLTDLRRLTDHAADTLGIELIPLSYEALVTTPETEVPSLLEKLGLPPEPACLTPEAERFDARTLSAEQVTKPINTSSVGRWKRYERAVNEVFGPA